jgi:RHS repeat-associated protein
VFNLRYPGQYADAESGLYYNYFRHYDPSIGRYAEADPIGLAGGVNRFVYVGGNPVGGSDPYGLCGPLCAVVAGAAVGGAAAAVGTWIGGGSFTDGLKAMPGGALGGAVLVIAYGSGGGSAAGALLGVIGDLGINLGTNAIDVAGVIGNSGPSNNGCK